MPDDVDNQPLEGDPESSTAPPPPEGFPTPENAASEEQSKVAPDESVEASDWAATDEAVPAGETADVSDSSAEAQAAPESEVSVDAEVVDETLDWAADETADKVLAEAQSAEATAVEETVGDEAGDDELLSSPSELNASLPNSDGSAAEFADEQAGAEVRPPDDSPAPAVDMTASADSDPAPQADPEPAVEAVQLPEFDIPATAAAAQNDIDLLDDVELSVKIELGRTEMYVENVLRLGVGSVVELDKLAGDPVDIWVNERLVARGEVLVLNDNFCVRVNEILSPISESDSEL